MSVPLPAAGAIVVPEGLARSHAELGDGEVPPGWTRGLPRLARRMCERWRLVPEGPSLHGVIALVVPVRRAGGRPAALKLQPVTPDNAGEPAALRAWDGEGAVRLLEHDPATGSMLLERADAARPLSGVPDDMAALEILAGLCARLSARPAPAGLRRLGDIAAAMLGQAPGARARLRREGDLAVFDRCAAGLREVADEPGDRLLHWDLHYGNVLAAAEADRGHDWLAIDPQPLAGDPCFELLPALRNRWDDVLATGDVAAAVRRRFDAATEIMGLDRERARAWTLGRVLQDVLWDIEDGETAVDPVQAAVALALSP